jgi:hypothetical protein
LQRLRRLQCLQLGTVKLLWQPTDNRSSSSSSSSSAAINLMAAMSQSLTFLELHNVIIHGISDSAALMRCLASLTGLQRLQLDNLEIQAAPIVAHYPPSSSGYMTMRQVLLQLTQLTSLSLNDWEKGLLWQQDLCLIGAAVGGLQQLQQLELHNVADAYSLF